MNYLKIALLWLALVICPQLITLKVATFVFSSESHSLYRRVELLIANNNEQQRNRLATISQMEARLVKYDGELLEEVDKRIALAIQRHERNKYEDLR
ncbi:hypothetical protein [Pseudomonas sp. BN515]|uniref:hypothetical protein n=1 Tax=Pseudomonas sp. BN515 TaxID=2567892 RepID=UPI002457FD4B|nr:hypothetical protein [Pseudomonas sp. BN515]MDH4872900.1 hypothetical protein [Pseudomonas sp. BN515]